MMFPPSGQSSFDEGLVVREHPCPRPLSCEYIDVIIIIIIIICSEDVVCVPVIIIMT